MKTTRKPDLRAGSKENEPAGEAAGLRRELAGAERQLQECRTRAQLMEGVYAHVADAVFVATRDGQIIDVNPAACGILGYSRDELLAMHPWDLATSASQDEILHQVQNLRPGLPTIAQRTYRSKAGVPMIMDLRLTRCELAGRDLIIVSCRNVTDQRRLEERLRRSERSLAEGQRLTKTGSWILDFETGNTDWSVETCRIFGFPDPPPSPHYSEFRARVRPEDRDGVDRGLRESFEKGEPRPLKYVFILPDGTRKHIETISEAVRDEVGELRLMGTVMDVTERVEAGEALQQSEDHLRLVIDTIPGLVWSAKPDGTIDYLNRRWVDYTGLTLEQARGWGWRAAIHPEDLAGLERYWRSVLASGQPGEAEARLRRFDGEHRWFLFRSVPLHDGSGKLVQWYGTNTDIDDRRRAAEALRAAEHLARGQLAALTHTLDSLAQESDPDKLPKHVVTTLLTQMDAHSATIWERNEESLDLSGIVEEGRFKTRNEAGYFEGSIPVSGPAPPLWVEGLRTGTHIVIEDINKEPTRILLADGRSAIWQGNDLTAPFAKLKAHLTAQGVRGLLISPMMLAGKLAGIIGIRFTGTRVFGCDEIELTKALAHQAMLAMQLMRLSQQSREAAVIAERNRVARDIHDTLAQGFTGVIMQLEAAKGAATQGDLTEAVSRIERAGALARSSLGEARRSVRALRPRSLRNGKLFLALDNLLKRMTEGIPLNADFRAEGDERCIPPDYEDGLLRIAQESLTNVIKHANARNFKATLSVGASQIQLQLVDDGRGLDLRAGHEGFGLIGMKERVEQMNGEFIIRSKPGVGTEILVILKNQNPSKPENGND